MNWRIEGISEELQKIYESNMDEAPARRRVREAFRDIQFGIDHCLLQLPEDGLKIEEVYEVNSRGLQIFTKSWLPETSPLKGAIYYCHGYGDTCSFYFEGLARKLASSGYGVFAMDYPGFGLSEGLHGYIPSFDTLVADVIEQFSKVKERKEFKNLPSFLLGQSMGGAMSLKIHLKQPTSWDGAILIAPLCKLADNMLPHWLIKQILIRIARLLPKHKLVPKTEGVDNAFRDDKKRELAPYNVLLYKDKPRLGTALELLKITQEIEQRFEEVSLPLLILHGEADVITDPTASKALYEKAGTSDKKLCLYKDASHTLLEGEPDETIFQALKDITQWLEEHADKKTVLN